MDIEKIKNYNQKMLAVFLTALVALAAIGLLSLIIFLLTQVFDYSRNSSNYPQEGIQVDETQQYAEKTNNYKLHASYNFPDLIDTINQIYIIPVSHQTQYEIENSLIKRGKFSGIGSSEAYDYYSQSTFINLLVYDAKNGIVDKLFNQQVLVGQYGTFYCKDDIIIVFEASDKDSNKDGKLTMSDETALYFYSIRNKTMKVAGIEGQTVLQFSFIGETRNAIIRFGKNPDLRSEKENEKVFSPGILCQFNYDSDKLVKINDPKLDAELENIAGGKNK